MSAHSVVVIASRELERTALAELLRARGIDPALPSSKKQTPGAALALYTQPPLAGEEPHVEP
jgi:hypothetical protein